MPWKVVRIKTFIAKIALSVSCQRRDDESLSFLLCALDKPISVRSTLNNRVTPWTKQSSYSLSRTMTGKLTRTLGARKKSHHQWWIQLSSPAILKMSGLVTEAFDMCTEFCREGSVVNPVLRSLTGNQCWETLHHFVMWKMYLDVQQVLLNLWLSTLAAYLKPAEVLKYSKLRRCPGSSLVAQTVKNPPAMQETQVQCLGREDLEKGTATHSSILAWRIPWTEEPAGYSPWGHKESDTTEQLILSHFHFFVVQC